MDPTIEPKRWYIYNNILIGEKEKINKLSHVYYYHVQGQLQILNRSWCDFYVWTPRLDDMVVERIDRDQSFWNDYMFKKILYELNAS